MSIQRAAARKLSGVVAYKKNKEYVSLSTSGPLFPPHAHFPYPELQFIYLSRFKIANVYVAYSPVAGSKTVQCCHQFSINFNHPTAAAASPGVFAIYFSNNFFLIA